MIIIKPSIFIFYVVLTCTVDYLGDRSKSKLASIIVPLLTLFLGILASYTNNGLSYFLLAMMGIINLAYLIWMDECKRKERLNL